MRGACVGRSWGLVAEGACGVLCRGLTRGGCGGLGRVGKCGSKVGRRLCGRFDNCSSGGSGSEFKGNSQNRWWHRTAAIAAGGFVSLDSRLYNCISGGSGRGFQGRKPDRPTFVDGSSNDADIVSRIWVGTTWSIAPQIKHTADRGVFGCRPVEIVGATGAFVSECHQTKTRGDYAQGVERGDGWSILNRCGYRRGRVRWAAMGDGEGMLAATCRLGR